MSIGRPAELKRFWGCAVNVWTRVRNGLGCVRVRTVVAVADNGWARICVCVCVCVW